MGNFQFLPYLKLFGCAMLPVLLSGVFYALKKKTKFGQIKPWTFQLIIGLVFGALSIFGTELGIPISNAEGTVSAVLNVRDAAPICAGLIFGGPAGIIAGLIGGVERFMAVYWGVGAYTRVACSVSTVLAGLYAALLRKFIFRNQRPSWLLAGATGGVIEMLHMLSVFLTHPEEPDKALNVVMICILPMTVFSAIACALSVLSVESISHGLRGEKHKKTITSRLQSFLLILVVLCYILSSIFVFVVQTYQAKNSQRILLQSNVNDAIAQIQEQGDASLLKIGLHVEKEIENYLSDPEDIKDKEYVSQMLDFLITDNGISEINIVDENNIIIMSSDPNQVGFDMNSSHLCTSAININRLGVDQIVEPFRNNAKYPNDASKSRKYCSVKSKTYGFVQVGYDKDQYEESIKNAVQAFTNNRHIGNSGYLVITNYAYKIISNGSSDKAGFGYYYADFSSALGFDSVETSVDTLYQINLDGEEYFALYNNAEGYIVIAVITVEEAYSTRNSSLIINSMIQILIYAAVFILTFVAVDKVIIKRIDKVNEKLQSICAGDLDTVIDETSTTEFESLSAQINATVNSLKQLTQEAEERIAKELELATNIQTSALPSVFPAFPNIKSFDIHATMNTAKEVGGDFYDFYMLGESRLCFLIADVSGKGVPAAMFMMQSKTMIKNFVETGMDLGEAITNANNELCEHNDTGMFVTAFVCILDLKTGHVEFVNAGHNPPLVYRKDKGFEYLTTKPGFVLAGMDGFKYKNQFVDLEPGDQLYLYTDGVTEAIDLENNMYGEDRLQKTLNKLADKPVKDILLDVKNDIDEFVGEAEQFDDITMLMVKYQGEDHKNVYSIEEEFRANDKELDNVLAFIEREYEKTDGPLSFLNQLNIVVEELFVNIAHYAYKPKGIEGKAWITFEYAKDTKDLSITLLDEGIPFNPLAKEDPDITLSAEERQIGGLGIYMVKKIMDEVHYEHANGENILTIKKHFD